MGQANPQDPYIVARVLGKDAVPLSHFTDPEDRAIAKRMGFKDGPAAPATGAAANPMQKDPAQQAAGAAATKPTGFVKPPPGVIFNEPAGAPELVGTQNQAPDAAAQADRIANRMDQEAGAGGAGQTPTAAAPEQGEKAATKPAAADPAVAATREKFKALMDKLEKTGGVSGSAPTPAATAPAAKPAATATKPVSGAQSAGQSVGGAIKSGAKAVGDFAKGAYQGITKESVSFEDDKTLLAIKNIRY